MRTKAHVSLAERTTLGLGGTCTAEVTLETLDDLERLPGVLSSYSLPVFVLGAGSNILAMDGEHELLLLCPDFSARPEILADEGERVSVRVSSGTPLPQLLAFCRREGLTGLEGLAGIPGRVGGAIAMNAGSFGSCMGEALARVDIWSDGALYTFEREQIELAYRVFAPKKALGKPWFVTGATLVLARDAHPEEVGQRMAEHMATKKARQPVTARSAGCVFKNPPEGPSAGVLLDRAGYRGKSLGGVAFSAVHANFLVNTGQGRAEDAVRLLCEARDRVAQLYGTELSLEVKTLPWHSL